MTMWVWEADFKDVFLCDICIHNDERTQCCTADDCFGGDHFENQRSLLEED